MNYVEAEGNTIDEAIERALGELGVSRDKAAIEILCNTARGLFGIGSRKARVRASLRREIELDEQEPGPGRSLCASGDAKEEEARRPGEAEQEERQPPLGDDSTMIRRAQEVLQDIVRLMGIEAEVTVVDSGHLLVQGDKLGVLIGRRGQTLDALEYVLNSILAREDYRGRVVIDTEHYRERRRVALEALALKLAERVRHRGKAVSLNPMSPRDRRIVHLALQGDTSLVTRSTGEGYYRRLVIEPAEPRNNASQQKRRELAAGAKRQK